MEWNSGTVEWNGTVEWWNSGMIGQLATGPVAHAHIHQSDDSLIMPSLITVIG